MASPLYLALDTTSPVASIALGSAEGVLCLQELAQRACAEQLVPTIANMLAETETTIEELAGIGALAGPGSFTGIRIGLATVLGLHQATGIPATALGTLETIASAASADGRPAPLLALVNALRGQWFVQPYDETALPLEEPERLPEASLESLQVATVAGHGVSALAELGALPRQADVLDLPVLAPALLARLVIPGRAFDAAALMRPLYLQSPSITRPNPPGKTP